jgi:hypothetical protein
VLVEGDRAWMARTGTAEMSEFVQTSPGAPWKEVARFHLSVRPPNPTDAGTGAPLAFDQGLLLAGGFESRLGVCRVMTRGVVLQALPKDQAADEEALTLRGEGLERVTQVLLNAEEQPIVSQSPTELVVRPSRRAPGFADLALVAPEATLTLSKAFESLPSLSASSSGLGGRLDVELENGSLGAFVLAFGLDLRPRPLVVNNPPSWYGLLLALLPGRYAVLDMDAIPMSGGVSRSYALPSDPALLGLPFHVQAWCQRGLFGPVRYSFTNAVTLAF